MPFSQKQELENKLNISSVNTGTFDPTSDNPAGQKSAEFRELQRQVRDRISSLRGRGNADFLFTLIDFGDYDFGDIIYFDSSMYYGITDISSTGSALSVFVASNIRRITYSPILDRIFYYAKDMRECFSQNGRLTFIGEFNISNCTNLYGAFAKKRIKDKKRNRFLTVPFYLTIPVS